MTPQLFFLFLGAGLVLFLIGREIACWYFKINKTISLLEQIEENTRPKVLTHDPLKIPRV